MINHVSSEMQYLTAISDTAYGKGYFICNGKYYDIRSSRLVSKMLKMWHRTDKIMHIIIDNPHMELLDILRT